MLVHEVSRTLVTTVLPALIRGMEEEQPSLQLNPDGSYHRALQFLVSHLLLRSSPYGIFSNLTTDTNMSSHLRTVFLHFPPLTPQQIGNIYEYLRGFKLAFSERGEPTLVPSRSGTRNQGLFYTPQRIVSHIVTRTLDTLEITDPLDYLNLLILDPAVGTGVFLVEAMRQLIHRVLSPGWEHQSRFRRESRNIVEDLRIRLEAAGAQVPLDESLAVRIHLAEKCLHGVDLDPIAIQIARFALVKETFGNATPLPDLELHLRLGNSLIGSVRGGDRHPINRELFPVTHSESPSEDKDSSERSELSKFHWSAQFPEVFRSGNGGFHAVIGNPPYEIVSVKESGIARRSIEQSYYRQEFTACKGKINLYRLMLERGLDLLRSDGALGFIVPATLLSDSTALPLRTLILNTSEIVEAVVIPEKAKAFSHVTQALAILVCRKGRKTRAVTPITWDGQGPIRCTGGIQVSRTLIEKSGWRIPILKSLEEKVLMEALMAHPPLGGTEHVSALGRVHQGEVNLTVDREFITTSPTEWPLIRGEHVGPFRVIHPSTNGNRLDWILSSFFGQQQNRLKCKSSNNGERPSVGLGRAESWKQPRIVLARVVNMATSRRLKAALVQPECFLGDMTNFVTDLSVSADYLIGMLNSNLLNWRIKLTSTNNYLSAAEIEALPVPRIDFSSLSIQHEEFTRTNFLRLVDSPLDSVSAYLDVLNAMFTDEQGQRGIAMAARMVDWIAQMLRGNVQDCTPPKSGDKALNKLLDALVLKIYLVDSLAVKKIFHD